MINTSTGEILNENLYPDDPLSGLSIVISGTFPNHTREDIENIIYKAGGNVVGSVSKKTSLLVVGDNPGSKLLKAQELGTKIITLNQLLEIIENAQSK